MDEFYVVKCVGVIGAHGNVPPVGRWLAGFDPNLIPAEGCEGLSTWAIDRSGAVRFRTRDEAQDCIDAVPDDNPRRADGTAAPPVSVELRDTIRRCAPGVSLILVRVQAPRAIVPAAPLAVTTLAEPNVIDPKLASGSA